MREDQTQDDSRSSAPRLAVIDCGSRRIPDIVRCCAPLCRHVDVVPLAQAAARVAGADALIVSGGPHLFTGPGGAALVEGFCFLAAVKVPTLGICLGHQALGTVHGVEVFRGEPRRETETVQIVGDHALVAGLGAAARFDADHCEGIPLPPGFVCLGGSEHYRVEIMAHATRPLFGVQFHPETSGEPGERILRNFLRQVGESA